MKRFILLILFLVAYSFSWITSSSYTWDNPDDSIYTKNQDNVIDTNNASLRKWTLSAAWWIEWVAKTNDDDYQSNMLLYISKWINYFLWFLWLLVIILIIKDGIIMITSAWDEWKKKEAFVNLKNYIIALIWIWSSYMIINLIFYFVNVNTWVIS